MRPKNVNYYYFLGVTLLMACLQTKCRVPVSFYSRSNRWKTKLSSFFYFLESGKRYFNAFLISFHRFGCIKRRMKQKKKEKKVENKIKNSVRRMLLKEATVIFEMEETCLAAINFFFGFWPTEMLIN